MPIDNVEAVKFCNEMLRGKANILAQNYYAAKEIVDQWNSKNLAAIIPNTSDIVIDNSATDGRHQISGADATAIITRCEELIADYEATNNAKLNTVLQVAVQPFPR